MANLKSFTEALDFTRASTATYFDENGVLQTAAVDEARFNHDPVTGEALGLLVEESRTNLLTYSEALDDAAWTKTRSSVTPNAEIAPHGLATADKLVEDATADTTHLVRQAAGDPSAGVVSTVFLKAAERGFAAITLAGGGNNNIGVAVNLSTGELSAINDVFNSWDNEQATAQDVGTGWWRVSLSGTITTGSTSVTLYISTADSLAVGTIGSSVTGANSGYGIYIWGAQIEQGAFPTSYIPTAGAAVTRSSDSLTRTLGNEYNASQGEIKLTSKAPVGETLLTLGSLSIVSDLDDFKEYILDYTSDPSATSLVFGNGTHKKIEYFPSDLP